MWETVELREVRAFLVLAEELHFGRAAERLGVTQSRVSQMIRQLETKLGGPLFDRTSRRVSLTPSGERLLVDLPAAHSGLASVLQRAHAGSQALTGPLRLGLVLAMSGGPHLLEIVEVFERRHPASQVRISDVAIGDPLGPLRRGEVDLIAIRLPIAQPDLEVGAILSEDPLVLAVARDHPLAGRESVTIEDVADYEVTNPGRFPRELGDAYYPAVTPGGKPLRRLREPPQSYAEIIALVARGRVVHVTVASFAQYFGHPNITCIPMIGMPTSKTGLVWRRDRVDGKVREFDRVARDVLDTKA